MSCFGNDYSLRKESIAAIIKELPAQRAMRDADFYLHELLPCRDSRPVFGFDRIGREWTDPLKGTFETGPIEVGVTEIDAPIEHTMAHCEAVNPL